MTKAGAFVRVPGLAQRAVGQIDRARPEFLRGLALVRVERGDAAVGEVGVGARA